MHKSSFRIYRVTSGDISEPNSLQLTFVAEFPSIGSARQYLRTPEFLQHLDAFQLQGDYLIVSTHQHYRIQPVTTLHIRSISQTA
jgi:hypothetical protein